MERITEADTPGAARRAPGQGRPHARAGERSAGAAACVLAAALLAGCGITPQRLTVRDSSSHDAEFRASVRPAIWSRAGGPARGFEAGYQQFRAEGTQTLATGETLNVRAATINGPDVLLQQAKVVTWHLGYTDRLYLGPAFELDWAAGGMKTEMDYELRPQSGAVGTQPFARAYTLPYGAVTPRWRFNAHLALESRLVAAGLTDDAEHRRYDVALVLRPVPPLALRLGYSWRRTRVLVYSDPVFSSVDVSVRGRGPAASVLLEF